MSTAYMPPTTLPSLKEYVSGSSTMQQSAESTVQLYITHCHLKAQFPEIRLDKHVSSSQLHTSAHHPTSACFTFGVQ
jgi:hypothetical protein